MTHTCLYCKSPFVGERSTKKYCDENCRQLAYIARKRNNQNLTEAKLSSVENPISVKFNVEDSFYANSVKHVENNTDNLRSQPAIKTAKPKIIDQDALDGIKPLKRLTDRIEALESVLTQQNNLILTMWTNIKSGLESNKLTVINELHKELSKHNPFWRGLNGQNDVNNCKPCNVKSFTLSSTVEDKYSQKIFTTQNAKQENEELKNAQEHIKQLREKLAIEHKKEVQEEFPEFEEAIEPEKIKEIEKEAQETKIIQLSKDQPYQWINPKLHILIQRQLNKGDGGHSFRHALEFWSVEQTQNILWVNVRLRCLLDNLVRLSLHSGTNYETLAALTNAFIDLSNSEHYNRLPLDYPYINLIAEQADTLKQAVMKDYSSKRLRNKLHVWMSVKQKATIVAACTELGQSTEKVSFSDLSFKTVKLDKSFIDRAKTFQKEKINNNN